MGTYSISPKRRQAIYARDKHTCGYCGRKHPIGRLTLDHIKPQAQGGSNQICNLVTACGTCNMRKGNKTLGQYLEYLMLEGWPVNRTAIRKRINRMRARKLPRM
jgi:5-methylcytosine-specific restriction endonuclease McrA